MKDKFSTLSPDSRLLNSSASFQGKIMWKKNESLFAPSVFSARHDRIAHLMIFVLSCATSLQCPDTEESFTAGMDIVLDAN